MKESDFDEVRLDRESYDRVRTLHYNWYLHGIKAIMGQLGRDLWKKLDRGGTDRDRETNSFQTADIDFTSVSTRSLTEETLSRLPNASFLLEKLT